MDLMPVSQYYSLHNHNNAAQGNPEHNQSTIRAHSAITQRLLRDCSENTNRETIKDIKRREDDIKTRVS